MIAALLRALTIKRARPLDLSGYPVIPGDRVITRRVESERARIAYGQAEARRLKLARLRFEGDGA